MDQLNHTIVIVDQDGAPTRSKVGSGPGKKRKKTKGAESSLTLLKIDKVRQINFLQSMNKRTRKIFSFCIWWNPTEIFPNELWYMNPYIINCFQILPLFSNNHLFPPILVPFLFMQYRGGGGGGRQFSNNLVPEIGLTRIHNLSSLFARSAENFRYLMENGSINAWNGKCGEIIFT